MIIIVMFVEGREVDMIINEVMNSEFKGIREELFFKINNNHRVLIVIIVLEIWHRKDSVGDALFYQKMTVFWSFSTASTPATPDGFEMAALFAALLQKRRQLKYGPSDCDCYVFITTSIISESHPLLHTPYC